MATGIPKPHIYKGPIYLKVNSNATRDTIQYGKNPNISIMPIIITII
jgi:hypothetical protein